MLLALDVGNTNVTVGLFNGEELQQRWRLRTVLGQTADEWGILIRNLFSLEKLRIEDIDGVIISSVVPPLDLPLTEMSTRYLNKEPLFVSAETDTGLKVLYENPAEVGADRIVNSVAAYRRFGGPCVIVDFGTAITFDIVSEKAEYLGGIICPGIEISAQALFSRTARLPLVELRRPASLIGRTTVGSIQSGLFFGTVELVDGLLRRLKSELGSGTQTVATGGQAHLIVPSCSEIERIEPDLTLYGLAYIWQRAAQKQA